MKVLHCCKYLLYSAVRFELIARFYLVGAMDKTKTLHERRAACPIQFCPVTNAIKYLGDKTLQRYAIIKLRSLCVWYIFDISRRFHQGSAPHQAAQAVTILTGA